MKISVYCQFEPNTANGIVMHGKAEAFANEGNTVWLCYQPFKFLKTQPSNSRQLSPFLKQTILFSYFFKASFFAKLIKLPNLIYHLMLIFYNFYFSDIVLLHKPLPLSFFYLLVLKLSLYRGKTILYLDDWEGVGGFATVRNADKPFNKLLVTLCEETMPNWSDGCYCTSKLLFNKMMLSNRTREKAIYLPNGASEKLISQPKTKHSNPLIVGYVGTFKNKRLIKFLLDIALLTKKAGAFIKFKFIGGGDEFSFLLNQRDELGLKDTLELTGQIEHDEVKNQLFSTDICLVYLNHEFPDNYIDASRSSVKLFEYMAYGKIILASDFGEPRHVLTNNETGYLAENHPDAFAQKLLTIERTIGNQQAIAINVQDSFKKNYTHKELARKFFEWVPRL